MAVLTPIVVENACETWEWIDADGAAHAFSEANGAVPGQGQGFWMPPTRRVDRRVPGLIGAQTLDRTYGERSAALQVAIVGNGPAGVEAAIAAWARRFNVLRGAGQLRHTRVDGTRRVLYADYDDGFGVAQNEGIWRKGVQQAVLRFFASDPAWYDDDDTDLSFTEGAGVTFFPLPNPDTGSFITLSGSEVFSFDTIDNDGDFPAWPTFTIEGPAGDIAFLNLTTDKTIDLTGNGGLTLAAGETLTVVTKPGSTVVEVDDANAAQYLTDASELWSLALGENDVQVEASGTTVATTATMTYRRGWLTP